MSTAPNTDNYVLGKGVVYFDRLVSSVYQGERDLGNAPAFTINIALEKLEHYSSRGGLKAKDKEIISQITPGCTFTLDEVNKENLALLTLGTITSVTQAVGSALAESQVANKGMRINLPKRALTHWNLPYDTGTALFVLGETVTGAGGATGVVVGIATGSTSVTGTLYVARTNTTSYVADEALTGSGSGAAAVNSLTGGTVKTTSTTPIVFIQDSTDTTTYVEGTDYKIDDTLNDGKIGRILWLEGSTITDGDTVHVTYGYAAITYNHISAFSSDSVEGRLRFVSDNPAGENQEMEIWSVSLTPSGDTAMIGDDWSTLAFTGEILKDETYHASNPYMSIIMDQELT